MSVILLTGSSGTLGQELLKLNPKIFAPSSQQFDVTNEWHYDSFHMTNDYMNGTLPDIIIHAAAETDNRKIEKDPTTAIYTNIIGTALLSAFCLRNNIRLVYLSTDYVYHGSHGNFSEQDPLQPFNIYSWTKLGGEASVKAVKNHLIIRTSFGKSKFDYPEAFTDKWASKMYADEIAPLILEAALSPLTGVLNLGGERKSLYQYAKERNPDVKPVKLEDTAFNTPKDTSLNLQKWMDYKSSKSIARPHTECRICGSKSLRKYLDLGLMPLANNLEFTAVRAKNAERFPLQVVFCENCGLSQLSVVIDPAKMFSYYPYRSSINKPYIDHCRQMAKDLKEVFGLHKDQLIIDLASNDGTLLAEFKDEIGLRTIGVDPASNLAAIAESRGIETVVDFWSEDVADKIVSKHGKAHVITATNVFAHVDNVKGFISAAKKALHQDGLLVIECPYLVPFVENMEYSSCYFEHLSTMSILPIKKLCEQFEMEILHVKKFEIHTGTIRVTIAHKNSKYSTGKTVNEFIEYEQKHGYDKFENYSNWAEKVDETNDEFSSKILELKKQGNKIVGFSASAKGATLLNRAGITTDLINYVIDQTPEKIGKYIPGVGIPIMGIDVLQKDKPDYICVLAWNFADTIMKKCRDAGFTGKFIVPIPNFVVID